MKKMFYCSTTLTPRRIYQVSTGMYCSVPLAFFFANDASSHRLQRLIGTVKKIAEFYGVELNPKEHKTVVEKCGFQYMKEHTHLFNYQLPLNRKFNGRIMENGAMTRKGIVGDGKVTFTEEGTLLVSLFSV